MPDHDVFVRPIQQFDDNIRPAQLMLDVYRLLDCHDNIVTEGELIERLREVVSASGGEDLMLVRNEIFLGLIRESANLAPSALKLRALSHLLRQAVVASCTALDAFLPALLRANLPDVIRVRGRAFISSDESVKEYFSDLTFSLVEVMRVVDQEDAHLYITGRILGAAKFKYLSSKKGIHVAGVLLGMERPWFQIAEHLSRDRKELMSVLEDTVKRRNDIVHRADRSLGDPDGEQQPITYAQARQGVDTIAHVSHALNELVEAEMKRMAEESTA